MKTEKHYQVFSVKNPKWSRIIVAASSFEARRIVAAACGRDVLEFYAKVSLPEREYRNEFPNGI